MLVCDVSALHEEILEGKGYKEITVHDINCESVSKSVWMWAMSVSIHEETAELKSELFLDSVSFGKEVVRCKDVNKPEDTLTFGTSQTPQQCTRQQGIRWSLLVKLLCGILDEYHPWQGIS